VGKGSHAGHAFLTDTASPLGASPFRPLGAFNQLRHAGPLRGKHLGRPAAAMSLQPPRVVGGPRTSHERDALAGPVQPRLSSASIRAL